VYKRDYILGYDTGQWDHIQAVKTPPCHSVWGTSSNNLFIGCDSGIVLHKDQDEWKLQQIPHKNQIIKISGISEQEIYAIGIASTMYFLYQYQDKKWITIDSVDMFLPLEEWHFGHVIWGLENENLYSAGENGIHVYSNGVWEKLIGGHPFRAVYGSSANNLFAAAIFGHVYHYNGSTWKKDNFFDNYYFDTVGNIWCNDDYVFIAVLQGYTSYIFRGEKIIR
jgi:hypothetical protein